MNNRGNVEMLLVDENDTNSDKQKESPKVNQDKGIDENVIDMTRSIVENMMEISTSEINCPCVICNKQFASLLELKKHNETVHKTDLTGLIVCEKCDETFADKDLRKKHEETVHSDETTKMFK